MKRPIVKEVLSMCNEDYIDKCQQQYEKYIDVLEKALDKAIEEINRGVDGLSHCPKNRDCLYDDWIRERDCGKCWKEYLLKEANNEQ